MTYEVISSRATKGTPWAVPALPGCWSQGETEAEAEALDNIRDAISEYLASLAPTDDTVRREALAEGGELREVIL
jgi:predicted RNase H-like HicB family nuclease